MFSVSLMLASVMAVVDTIILAGIKEYSTGQLVWRSFMPLAMVVYSLQPVVFLQSLHYESMTVMNLLWDVLSDLFVTAIGLFYFKEKLCLTKQAGLFFAFIAIILLSYEDI
jgi:multidrug transporter EmrE-like cation transporter